MRRVLDKRGCRVDVVTDRPQAGDGCRVSIVAFTADAVPDNRERCGAVGMDDCIAKPVSAAALDDALVRWTGLGGGRRG